MYTYAVLKVLEIAEWGDVLRTFTCIQGLMFDICMHVGTAYTYMVLKALKIVEWADVLRTFTCIQGLMFNICMHVGTVYMWVVLKALETCFTLCALLNHLNIQFNDLQHSCKGITPCS